MAKASSKRPTKPKKLALNEAKAAAKAQATFAQQARARGEVAPGVSNKPLAPGVLYTENAPGQLTRHRFSLLPPPEPAGTD